MLTITKSSPCEELMQAGNSINVILIDIYINSLHLFSMNLFYTILLKRLRKLPTVLPNAIYKFLDHSKMFSHFKLSPKLNPVKQKKSLQLFNEHLKITSGPSLFHCFANTFRKNIFSNYKLSIVI